MFKKIGNGQSYYAMWWICRVLAITTIILLFVVMTLIAVIWSLFPLKETVPMLVSFEPKSNQVVKIEPLEKEAEGWDLLVAALARQYVLDRETIDCHTETFRWHRLGLFSSEELESSFKEQMSTDKATSPLRQFCEQGITRTVHVMASSGLGPSAPNVWQVEWSSADKNETQEYHSQGHWVSTLTVDSMERAVKIEDQYVNPIGFMVTHYTVNRKDPS